MAQWEEFLYYKYRVSGICGEAETESFEDEFRVFSLHFFSSFFYVQPIYYHSEEFTTPMESLWSEYWLEPPF